MTDWTGKRVLLVGDFSRTAGGALYYNANFALQNGFIRAGCHVLTFSDRDVARESAVLRHKALGRGSMNRALVETAATYRPDLVLFGHVDMTGADTFAAIRQRCPAARLAQFNVDALFREETMARFRERAAHLDLSFITSATREKLAALAPRPGSLAYFPNPVDAGLARMNIAEIPADRLAYDGIFLGNGDLRRETQVRDLQAGLPSGFRFFAGGGIFATPRLKGPVFLETLATGAMSPNLPLDETRAVDHLYSSDRIAQLLALGIVAFCSADARLHELYEDGIVGYGSIAELAALMAELAGDDSRRRTIAATGRRIGLERTGAHRVATYMLDLVLGDGPSIDYGWPGDVV